MAFEGGPDADPLTPYFAEGADVAGFSEGDLQAYYDQLVHLFEERGGTQVSVKAVAVEGLGRTKGWLVTPQVSEVLTATTFEEVTEKAEEARLRLHRLGIFKEVDVVLDMSKGQDAPADAMDITYQVKEKGLVSGRTGMSFSREQGSADLSALVVNPLGIGDAFEFKAMRSSAGPTSYDLCYRLPMGGDMDFPLAFHIRKIIHSASVEYQTYSVMGQHNLSYNLDWRHVGQFQPGASFAVREEAGHTLKSSLQHVLRLDLLNEDETQGADVRLTTEVAGSRLGGCTNFMKTVLDATAKAVPVAGCEVSVSARGGVLMPIPGFPGWTAAAPPPSLHGASLAAPTARHRSSICDRFFLGGSTDVRGFKLNGIGPRVGSDAFGGDAFWAAALHLYTPFPYKPWRERFGSALRTHLFANAGSLARMQAGGLRETAERLISNPSATCGVGLSVQTALCTLEINYCHPLSACASDLQSPGLNVGVGMSFL